MWIDSTLLSCSTPDHLRGDPGQKSQPVSPPARPTEENPGDFEKSPELQQKAVWQAEHHAQLVVQYIPKNAYLIRYPSRK